MTSVFSKLAAALSSPAKIRWYVLLAFIVFVFGLFAGCAIGAVDPQGTNETMTMIGDRAPTEWRTDTFAMATGIFMNNALVACILYAGGLLVLPGAFIMGYNGAVVGMMFAWATQQFGLLAIPVVVIGIAPHGIIEIPATLLALGLGFRMIHILLLGLLGKIGIRDGGNEMLVCGAVFVLVVLPALFVAAFIEAYFTAWLLGLAAGI